MERLNLPRPSNGAVALYCVPTSKKINRIVLKLSWKWKTLARGRRLHRGSNEVHMRRRCRFVRLLLPSAGYNKGAERGIKERDVKKRRIKKIGIINVV